MAEKFGEFVRQKRLELKLSLRAFCIKHGEDPSNWSKVERGMLAPPSEYERLFEISQNLEIDKDDPDREKLFDLAFIGAGKIPPDIITDEELVKSLPIVFQMLRNKSPSERELMRIADLIRKDRLGKE